MKKVLYSAMMLAVLASCVKNENVGAPDATSTNEIMLSGKALSVDTKGAYTGTTPSAATPLKALVVGSTTDGDYSTPYVSGTMTFTDKAAGFDGAKGTDYTGDKNYPVSQASVFLMGFYPSENKAAGKWTVAANSAELDFAGTEDVMFAQQISTDSRDVAANGTLKSFDFAHQLTMLEVKVVVDGEQEIANAWGVLKDLKLVGTFNNKATVTMATAPNATIAFSNPVTDWSFYKADDAAFSAESFALPLSGKTAGQATDAELIAKATIPASTMLEPHTAVAGTASYKLAITTGVANDATHDVLTNVDIKLKSDAAGANNFTGDTKGYKFSILLVFKVKTIHATATVEAWKDGGTTIEPIE